MSQMCSKPFVVRLRRTYPYVDPTLMTRSQNTTGRKPWDGLWLDKENNNYNNSSSKITDTSACSFLKANNKNYYLNKDEVNYSYDYVGKIIDKPSETKIKMNDNNKIKVLIITTADKKRKVLTFDTRDANDLMISDLLKKSGITNNKNTKVSYVNDPLLAINYIIETECLFEKDKIEIDNDDYDTDNNNNKVKIKIEHENTCDYDFTDESNETDFLLNERSINDAKEIVIDYPKNTIVIDGKDGKIQILGVSKSGIQTLYNIDIYDETCTVYDLLLGIGVSMKNLIKVELIKFPHSSINYIVEHQDIVNNSDDVNNNLNIISEFKLDSEQQRRRVEFDKSNKNLPSRFVKFLSTKEEQYKKIYHKNNENNNLSFNYKRDDKYLVVEKTQIIFEKKFIRDPRNTLVHKKKNNIVRFLIVTKNGEENLIEVEIFNDKSTVNEIVKAMKRKFQFIGNAKISLIKNYPIFPINYLVEFKDENIY